VQQLAAFADAFKRMGCAMQTLLAVIGIIGLSVILLLITSLLGMNLLAGLFGPGAAQPTNAPVITAAPTAGGTSAPTVVPTIAPTAVPAGDMPAPVNLRTEPVDGEPGSFIVYWDYPEEGDVAPETFDIEVNGELYEHSSYEGTVFEYSWFVGDQPCNATLEVKVVAVAGALRGASDPIQVDTGAC
jgi:hypothetical protein